ncbi:MAG: tripartite tricarboxylate transporter permease [Thermodesulfobacteriota bacterium]
MSGWEHLLQGFQLMLTPTNLVVCLAGVLVGTVVGVLPGLGPLAAMSIILPVSIRFGSLAGFILLAGVWYGAQYGGSTTSILINIPGEASSVVTCLDGYQMARKGRAGAALAISAIGSFVAGTIGIIVLQLFGPPLASAALSFGPPEFLAVMLFACITLATLSGGSPLKGAMMLALGAILSAVGIDRIAGAPRFTLGVPILMYGIDFIPVAIGLFGVAEVIRITVDPYVPPPLPSLRLRELYPNREEARRAALPILRGSLVGALFGMLPGSSAALASFTAYSVERSISPRKKQFGTGVIEGVAAPESANNSAVILALVPLLCLGIPFSPVSAVLLAGLQMHNLTPGPMLLQTNPEIFWGLIAAMYIGNCLLLVLNLPLVGLFARISTLRPYMLMPAVVVLCLIGSYAIRNAMFDVGVMVAAGILGFFLNRLRIDVLPLILGLVLGSILEDHLRVTIQWFNGQVALIWTRPIALAILALIPIYLLVTRLAQKRASRELAGS